MFEQFYEESVRKNLNDALENYVGHVLSLDMRKMSNRTLRALQKNVVSFLTWSNMKRAQIKDDAKAYSTFKELLPAVLALYIDTVLCLSKIMSSKRRLEESSTILLKVSISLSDDIHRYLDVMLRLRYVEYIHLDLLKPLCRQCLNQKTNTNPEKYTKLIVLQNKLSSLWPKELSEELLEASKLLPPKNYLWWLERMDRTALKSMNLQALKDDKKIRDHLKSKVDSLGKVLTKILREIKTRTSPAEDGKESDVSDISCLSDDSDLKKQADKLNESSNDDDGSVSPFWGNKRTASLMEMESSSEGMVEDGEVRDLNEEEERDIGGQSGAKHPVEELDLAPEYDASSEVQQNVFDGKVEIARQVAVNETIPEESVGKNLKRKHESDDDSDEELMYQNKKLKTASTTSVELHDLENKAGIEVNDKSLITAGEKTEEREEERANGGQGGAKNPVEELDLTQESDASNEEQQNVVDSDTEVKVEITASQGAVKETIVEESDRKNLKWKHESDGDDNDEDDDSDEELMYQTKNLKVASTISVERHDLEHKAGIEVNDKSIITAGEKTEEREADNESSSFHEVAHIQPGVPRIDDTANVTEVCKRNNVAKVCENDIVDVCDSYNVTEVIADNVAEVCATDKTAEVCESDNVANVCDGDNATEVCESDNFAEDCNRNNIAKVCESSAADDCMTIKATEVCESDNVAEVCNTLTRISTLPGNDAEVPLTPMSSSHDELPLKDNQVSIIHSIVEPESRAPKRRHESDAEDQEEEEEDDDDGECLVHQSKRMKLFSQVEDEDMNVDVVEDNQSNLSNNSEVQIIEANSIQNDKEAAMSSTNIQEPVKHLCQTSEDVSSEKHEDTIERGEAEVCDEEVKVRSKKMDEPCIDVLASEEKEESPMGAPGKVGEEPFTTNVNTCTSMTPDEMQLQIVPVSVRISRLISTPEGTTCVDDLDTKTSTMSKSPMSSSLTSDTESQKDERNEFASRDGCAYLDTIQESESSSNSSAQPREGEFRKCSLRRGRTSSCLKTPKVSGPRTRTRKAALNESEPEDAIPSQGVNKARPSLRRNVKVEEPPQTDAHPHDADVQAGNCDALKASSRIPRWAGKSGDESSQTSEASNSDDRASTLRRSARIKVKGSRGN